MRKFVYIPDQVDPNDPDGRTYREIALLIAHNFSVGQLVEIDDGVRLFIAMKIRDCDGTPLYYLTPFKGHYSQERKGVRNIDWIGGISEIEMKVI